MKWIGLESRRVALAALVVCLAAGAGTSAVADVVYFNDANRGPTNSITIGSITLSGGTATTVQGVGAGMALGGVPGAVDRQLHIVRTESGYTFETSNFAASERLLLTVDGVINSITIMPRFSILGTTDTQFLPFEVSYFDFVLNQNSAMVYPTLNDLNPFAINFQPDRLPYAVEFSVTSDFGYGPGSPWFFSNIEPLNFTDLTVEFGYSVVSIDFTPVPEPSPFALTGLGFLGLFLARRSFRPHRATARPARL